MVAQVTQEGEQGFQFGFFGHQVDTAHVISPFASTERQDGDVVGLRALARKGVHRRFDSLRHECAAIGIAFLEDALARLGLSATTLHARAEDAAHMEAHRERYDAAVSRAVASCAVLQELTLPFVREGGVSIAWKGPGVAQELTAGRRAAFLLGGKVRGTLDAPVPGREDWQHVLLVTDKTGKTPAKYPRKAGTPGKKPLGM